jgi:hypothetical protein
MFIFIAVRTEALKTKKAPPNRFEEAFYLW